MPGSVNGTRFLLFAVLATVGAAGMAYNVSPTRAARIKLGPLEVDTESSSNQAPEQPPYEELKSGPVEVEVKVEDADPPDAAPYQPTSESPRAFPFSADGKRLVYHAKLTDVVDLGLAPFLQRVVDDATADEAAAIIIEIDTPGGRVDAAVQIKDLLLESEIPTIAFINRQAISAGALIAFAHDYIVWNTGGTMGAATPIQMGGGAEAQPVEEKMTSYMRGIMRATAEAKGRDPFVAECMVDADLVLAGFAPKGKLLTATITEGEALGLLDGKADSLEEVLAIAGLEGARVVRIQENWAETVARFLTHPIVSSALMSIGMLGIIIEFYTPGLGIAGILGAVALFLFFAGHLVVNLVGLEELLLLAIGTGLLVVEVLVIPGFGIPGVIGVMLIGLSLILALVGLDLSNLDIAWSEGLLAQAVLQFAASVVVAGGLFMLSIRYLPSVGPVKRLILFHRLTKESGYVPTSQKGRDQLVGRRGKAITDLRPGGKIMVERSKYDVTAFNEFITKGEEVTVLAVDGPRITVERTTEQGDSDAS